MGCLWCPCRTECDSVEYLVCQNVAGQKSVTRPITEEMYTLLLKRQPAQGQQVQAVGRQSGTVVSSSIVAASSSAPVHSAASIQLPSSGSVVASQAAAQAIGAGGQIIATPTAFAVSVQTSSTPEVEIMSEMPLILCSCSSRLPCRFLQSQKLALRPLPPLVAWDSQV
jgi:hypothetical protein